MLAEAGSEIATPLVNDQFYASIFW